MPEPSLNEVLWRLERLERKLDWIAANATVPLQGAEPRSAEAEGAADLAGSQTNPKAAESLPADLPPAFKPPSAPSAQDQQQPASLQPVASHPAPSRPEVAAKPVDAPAGPGAARVPQAATVPAMNRFADPSTPPQGPLPGSATQVATRASSEGNLGRYLLSIAAALLVVLSAVSLIALVWDQIPDLLKIGGLGVLAVLLVGLGAWLAKAKPRQQVAAATITGTGGALGFIAIIGGVLLHGVIPTYPAFALMVLWSFALLLVSGFVKQVFSAVVSMVGAIITIGFAAWHASTKPESALVVWTLVAVYIAWPRHHDGSVVAPFPGPALGGLVSKHCACDDVGGGACDAAHHLARSVAYCWPAGGIGAGAACLCADGSRRFTVVEPWLEGYCRSGMGSDDERRRSVLRPSVCPQV
ncbi:Predicted membrane protein [Actinomyces bovis]|uniref:Predicted membrane protein n=1 Tax=Actinomyces bovis TaxID=1658 RepID=A0ABY1VKU3_9ACTO|nr:DUF2157 domain-containing protein [Actinomyces bovis]SPT52372.1 Predicted membrane protein [Actinomyces bovis]VEG53954.1 Predicted membrane protein [Actinomyces israelii]